MVGWLPVTLVAAAAIILALLILLTIRRCRRPEARRNLDAERAQSLQVGISRLHQVSPHHHYNHDHRHPPGVEFDRDGSKKRNYFLFQRGISSRSPGFNWVDHPSLITDAVENGWSRFAFTTFLSSPSIKSARARFGPCGAGEPGSDNYSVEIGWEVCEGSTDFMQKIRLNPEMRVTKNGVTASSTGAASVVRTGLPLPGPHLGNSSFPQEAYFEITILSCNEKTSKDSLSVDRDAKEKVEMEKIKLIGEDFNAKNGNQGPSSFEHVASSHSQRRSKIDELRNGGSNNDIVLLCVGLTGGRAGPLQLKIPGSYPGSIGFNSTGSVYLDGTKLVFESEKDEWGRSNKVIGCGYNPSQKKVFFTVDSQLVHEIHCKTKEFGFPLYPTLAANTDATVLVNLGQSSFKFLPANAQRTPNPCFIGTLANSPALGYEDSKELFSMGRIDSQWLQRSATRSNNNTVNSIKAMEEYDLDSEGDLFEIVLDSTGRSPYTPIYH